MDLYQIRYFLKIVEVGSFTKAAEQLYVSQPSLSAGIKKLEQELDACLFERGKRRILLTDAGRLFQRRAQTILAEYQSIHRDLKTLKGQSTLRIATLHSLRSYNMASLIGAYQAQNPNVSIEICNGFLEDLQDWLERGAVDLTITWLREQDTPQTTQFLFHQPLTLAVPQQHEFTKLKSVCMADLDGQPYIERLNCEFWKTYPKLFESAGIAPKVVYSSNNEEWVISLIQANVGMSIMPVWNDLSNITYLPMMDLSLSRTVGLRWRSQLNSESLQGFLDFVVDHDWHVDF